MTTKGVLGVCLSVSHLTIHEAYRGMTTDPGLSTTACLVVYCIRMQHSIIKVAEGLQLLKVKGAGYYIRRLSPLPSACTRPQLGTSAQAPRGRAPSSALIETKDNQYPLRTGPHARIRCHSRLITSFAVAFLSSDSRHLFFTYSHALLLGSFASLFFDSSFPLSYLLLTSLPL